MIVLPVFSRKRQKTAAAIIPQRKIQALIHTDPDSCRYLHCQVAVNARMYLLG